MLKKIRKIITRPVIVLALASVAFSIFVFWDRRNSAMDETQETAATISNENTPSGQILGEEGFAPSADAAHFFSSQNFRSPQISFGGDAILIPSGEQAIAPGITDLKSELLMTKSDQRVKFVLNWKTNKLCVSSIDFKKEGEAQGKIVSEDGYGYEHSATLAPLNFSTPYSYTVSVRDKWGNIADSDKLAFYTGAPNVSIFDLLGSAFKDMFGQTGK